MSLESMVPIYLPRKQGMVTDEDYDTGITMNEENLNQNLNRLHGAVVDTDSRIAQLESTVSYLQSFINGRG